MTAATIGYHKTYRLSADNSLVEEPASDVPPAGSIAALLYDLRRRQAGLDARLASRHAVGEMRNAPPSLAGIYPLKVKRFTCSCECGDEDGMCEQLTDRLGNLKVITEVPFMRRGNMVFAIRSQGLVDPATGRTESVDALFGGGILWEGSLDDRAYDYDLLMFRSGKDRCVGRMTETIDLTRKLSDIDPGLYQAEIAYHLQTESNDAYGRPTLGRVLGDYAPADAVDQVAACYAASAAFGAAAASGSSNLPELAEVARRACTATPGKRYYQAYEAFLRGILYDAR